MHDIKYDASFPNLLRNYEWVDEYAYGRGSEIAVHEAE